MGNLLIRSQKKFQQSKKVKKKGTKTNEIPIRLIRFFFFFSIFLLLTNIFFSHLSSSSILEYCPGFHLC